MPTTPGNYGVKISPAQSLANSLKTQRDISSANGEQN